MNTAGIWILILGMGLVTYLPRMLPSFLIDRLKFGPQVEKYLRLLPYTAMASLIFPGVILIDENPAVGLVGGGIAALLAWRKCPVMTCVMSAIAADFVVYLILGQTGL